MRIRVVDYAGYRGGVTRFTVEALRALAGREEDLRFEVVSYGGAGGRYRELLEREGLAVPVTEIAPAGYWRMQRLPEGERLGQLFSPIFQWQYAVPEAALDGCDVVWFPNIQRHRLPGPQANKVVVTLHDVIPFQIEGSRSRHANAQEALSMASWFESSATIIVDSQATRDAASRIFGVPSERMEVIPLSSAHARVDRPAADLPYRWAERPFLLYPAHASPSKNHETLFEAIGRWGSKHPLVLTGWGANLPAIPLTRVGFLRRYAKSRGLVVGETLFPLGFVSSDVFHALLNRTWAMVFPTLEEGFGLPVLEAAARGIPVVCSDIPVLREQAEQCGAEFLWFDPRDPDELAARLRQLEQRYDVIKEDAVARARRLRLKSWDEVARDYLRFFARAGSATPH